MTFPIRKHEKLNAFLQFLALVDKSSPFLTYFDTSIHTSGKSFICLPIFLLISISLTQKNHYANYFCIPCTLFLHIDAYIHKETDNKLLE